MWKAPAGPSDGGSSRGGRVPARPSDGGPRLGHHMAGPCWALRGQSPAGPSDGEPKGGGGGEQGSGYYLPENLGEQTCLLLLPKIFRGLQDGRSTSRQFYLKV